MPTSIYLPAEEDTEVVITVGGKSPLKLDVFDLEDMFVSAQRKADDMNTDWKDEFPSIYKRRTGKDINKAQAVLLWEGLTSRIAELKKSLHTVLEGSPKQESPSPRKRKRKSG